MMNNRHYTTIEQSKHLLELGLKAESADMIYRNTINLGNLLDTNTYKILVDNKVFDDDIPCWSVGALKDLIPNHIHIIWHNGYINPTNGAVAFMEYLVFEPNKSEPSIFETEYELICYLLQNNYIKTE